MLADLFPLSPSLPPSHQVRHKYTGQEMVMKEMAKCTDDSKRAFLKEVRFE